MSPVEIYINGHRFGKTGSGPSELQLPNPPEGAVSWDGDETGFGQIVAGPDRMCKEFKLTKIGEEAPFEVAERSSGLFKMATNVKSLVVIKRV